MKAELDELEQEELDDRLRGADHVPLHQPETSRAEDSESTSRRNHRMCILTQITGRHRAPVEDDEEAQLRQLQAELAM